MTPRPSYAPLAALLLAALFLAGCGGGGGDGGKNDTIAMLEADVAVLQADLAAARQAQRDAEAAQADAEAAQADAEAAQALAEQQRNEANTVAGAAQAQAAAAAQKQQDAEAVQQAAEMARDAAIEARDAAVTARDAALADKKAAEDALAAANTSKTMTEAELATVRQQLATANTNLQTAQNNLQTATADLEQAQTDLATRTRERDAAVTARNEAERALAVAQGTLEGLRAQLTQAQQAAADAEQRRLQAEQEAAQKIKEAEQQANLSVRAGPLLTALDLAVGDGTPATVTHPRGSSLTFMPVGSPARGSAAPSVPGGWRSASFSGPRGAAGTDTAYLYTNIQPPSTRAFWKIYGESVTYDGTDALAKPSGLPGAGRSLLDPDGDGTEIANPPAMRRLSGSYDGAGGAFECIGTTCNISRADDGTLTTAGDWTFTPGSLNTGVNRNQDEAYLYFGIWAYEPKTPTADHEFKWIAGGDTGNISDTNFGLLEGTATFTGGAVGRYVLRNQVGQADRIGTFTATATFTANFDLGNDGNPGNSLSGNLSHFQEGGTPLAGWSVYLGSNASTAATLGAAGVTAGEAHASIGGVTATGGWAASLHGADNAYTTLTDNTDYTTTKYPAADVAGVAGWFDAFNNPDNAGAPTDATTTGIAGAFGAACTTGAACAR